MTEASAKLLWQNQNQLARFVVRLRRVAAHSLAKDIEVLGEYATGTSKLQVSTAQTVLRRLVPSQEELESLGARVRPLLLEKEQVHYRRGIGALGYLLLNSENTADSAKMSEMCKNLKKEWRSLEEHYHDAGDPTVQVFDSADQETYTHTWRELAWAWVYIDLVHEDTSRIADSGRYGIIERYWGGMVLMARAARRAVAHLGLIRECVESGYIELPAFAFEEKVEVSQEDFVRQVTAHSAPIGTEAPENFERPGKLWTRMGVESETEET